MTDHNGSQAKGSGVSSVFLRFSLLDRSKVGILSHSLSKFSIQIFNSKTQLKRLLRVLFIVGHAKTAVLQRRWKKKIDRQTVLGVNRRKLIFEKMDLFSVIEVCPANLSICHLYNDGLADETTFK